jgi:hypothetical protein
MQEITQATKELIAKYSSWKASLRPKEGVSTIHVDEVASKVAALYEQIRTVVDWQEEHLMRRSAVIRKLKMRLADLDLKSSNEFSVGQEIAEPLIFELIRGGHFPNDTIGEIKIQEVQKIINKYIFILKNSPENENGKAGLQFFNWLIEILACEIEECLAPAIRETALIDYMFSAMKERIKVSERIFALNILKKEDTDLQIYIAIQQALFKFDKPITSYNLIKYKYPVWKNADKETIIKISENIFKIWNKIEKDLAQPILKKFYTVCEKYDTPYLLIGDILSTENLQEITKELSMPEKLEALIRTNYKTRLSTLKARLKRAAIYSTISIFVTKILSLLALEVIVAKLFLKGDLNYILLLFDILIPTVLMFILVATIKPPSEKNLTIVVMETMKIIFKKEKQDVYEIKAPKNRGSFTKFIVSFFYLTGTFISFGLVFWIFYSFKFPITSIIINILFIALILFAGMAIRTRSRELSVEDENEGFLSFISDILLLPIAGLGRWMSKKWKKYNAFAAFFNALIDMPFSVFIEFIEKWRYFIKEKKEDIR